LCIKLLLILWGLQLERRIILNTVFSSEKI
jgi:hypothetical protein